MGEISIPSLEVKFEVRPRELIVQYFQKASFSMETGAVCIHVNTQRYVGI